MVKELKVIEAGEEADINIKTNNQNIKENRVIKVKVIEEGIEVEDIEGVEGTETIKVKTDYMTIQILSGFQKDQKRHKNLQNQSRGSY